MKGHLRIEMEYNEIVDALTKLKTKQKNKIK